MPFFSVRFSQTKKKRKGNIVCNCEKLKHIISRTKQPNKGVTEKNEILSDIIVELKLFMKIVSTIHLWFSLFTPHTPKQKTKNPNFCLLLTKNKDVQVFSISGGGKKGLLNLARGGGYDPLDVLDRRYLQLNLLFPTYKKYNKVQYIQYRKKNIK